MQWRAKGRSRKMDFRVGIPKAWLSSLKKSMKCRTHPADVYEPEAGVRRRKGEEVANSSPCSFASYELPATSKLLGEEMRMEREPVNNESMLLSQHHDSFAFAELGPGDTTRNVVEIIFRTNWFMGNPYPRIERVLRINSGRTTLESFEDYREMVKAKASTSKRKHTRCMADGNELLRFHTTTITNTCIGGSPCNSVLCNVCQIMFTKFLTPSMIKRGILTTSTIASTINDQHVGLKQAVMVCRVIAGRIRKPVNNNNNQILLQPHGSKFHVPHDFDSIAGAEGAMDSKLEHLYVSKPSSILPCFLVIYS